MKDLVLLARRDETARFELIKNFEPLIFKCIKMYIYDRNLIQDAMQEGYMTVLKCIYSYDIASECGFPGYVKMAVINNVRRFSNKHKDVLSLDEEYSEGGGTLLDTLSSTDLIEEDFIKLQLNHELINALKILSDNEKELILSIYIKQIKIVQLSNGTRRNYVSIQRKRDKALSKLRTELKKSGYA